MFPSLLQRRYLIPFKASDLPQQTADVLVIGGGVAGLRAAIAASETADVLLVTKDSVEQSNTWYAQGGIAAVLQPLDSYEMHVNDTESAGAGLCDDRAVQIVIPGRVLVDKAIGGHLVALILHLQSLRQHLADHVVILVVMDTERLAGRVKRKQSILQEEIPLHELHCVVGLIAARLIVLQYAQDAAGINTLELCISVIALLA